MLHIQQNSRKIQEAQKQELHMLLAVVDSVSTVQISLQQDSVIQLQATQARQVCVL